MKLLNNRCPAASSTFALCALLFVLCVSADAQQAIKIPRIGYISGTGNATDQGPYVESLRRGLRDLGHVNGRNIVIEFRGAEGKLDRVKGLISELVHLNVDILVIPLRGGILAARDATKTTPIVMVAGIDPVADGLVNNLARPGGNITGLSTLSRELGGKRFELLTEMVPQLYRVGVLKNSDEPSSAAGIFEQYQTAAKALNIEIRSLEVGGPNPDLEGAFRTAIKERLRAIITITSAPLFLQRKRIVDLALTNRIATAYQGSVWVEAGGLMSYSSDDIEAFRRAAWYVDKILNGTKPAELPIEQPTKFELVI
ncbi:MAG TPA: ABC transporter substrate-binding protein, partial [Candidatus Binatia bacterium]|nr:ABC transporter substrate-binding protein [Candidatus Binatia bacterium]